MAENVLTENDKQTLLQLARKSIQNVVKGKDLPQIELSEYSSVLKANGACFVTLTRNGMLRGCIGSLEASQPLVLDVIERAASAAVQDYRFPPLSADEMESISIEISVLTEPQKLEYENPEALLKLVRPGVDGVVLQDGMRRATFLPQVWEKLPDADEFFSHLCSKMGAPANVWKKQHLEVYTYQVIEFHE